MVFVVRSPTVDSMVWPLYLFFFPTFSPAAAYRAACTVLHRDVASPSSMRLSRFILGCACGLMRTMQSAHACSSILENNRLTNL